jgi:hypothetical protein
VVVLEVVGAVVVAAVVVAEVVVVLVVVEVVVQEGPRASACAWTECLVYPVSKTTI